MYVILGIGNPGKKYEGTRHNIGFIALDYMGAHYGVKINKIKHKALIGEGNIAGEKVILVKPLTYMNLSGECIGEIVNYFKIDETCELVVIADDISLDVGFIRMRKKGSAGGHNGLKSIIANLGHENFVRMKMGVGDKPAGYDLADYVLGRFSAEEETLMREALADAARACEMFIMDELSAAMNLFNKKKKQENNESVSGTVKGN